MEVGNEIKRLRVNLDLSQDNLADKIFVTRQTISNWENDKTYPDIKSLALLSCFFNVSIDTLIKKDCEKMMEKIKKEDVKTMNKESKIFGILMIICFLIPMPLFYYLGITGFVLWMLCWGVVMVYATKIEKLKKQFDIQTYKEVIAFSESKELSYLEKSVEVGKRPYQNFLIPLGFACVVVIVNVVIALFLIYLNNL